MSNDKHPKPWKVEHHRDEFRNVTCRIKDAKGNAICELWGGSSYAFNATVTELLAEMICKTLGGAK